VDGVIYLHAGPEIGVASTKAFTSQVAALTMFTLRLARLRGLSVLEGRRIVEAIQRLPEQVERVLAAAGAVESIAERFARTSNALYLGRGYNFPVALEGALKLKEISYIHAEGYPAAEMKHGPIALIDEHLPVVVVAPRNETYEKVISNLEEVRARGGKVILLTDGPGEQLQGKADVVLTLPSIVDELMPVLTVVPLQLLAYHIAVLKGTDVDQPRNLAKSVTVE